MDVNKLAYSVALYGATKTKKILAPVLSKTPHRRNAKTVQYAH